MFLSIIEYYEMVLNIVTNCKKQQRTHFPFYADIAEFERKTQNAENCKYFCVTSHRNR